MTEMYLDARGYLCTEISRLEDEQSGSVKGNSDPSVEKTDGNQIIPIELPKQHLPKFGGNPREWLHFESLFNSAITENKALSDVQRLRYLNACLEGEAVAAIANLSIGPQNFQIAWKTLEERFGLPRIITAALLVQIICLKPIHKDDLASVQQVTIGVRQAMAALQRQGHNEEGKPIVHLIADRFDWELKSD
ncbi:uncharacterized protein LOC144477606 [Augochlora pura]